MRRASSSGCIVTLAKAFSCRFGWGLAAAILIAGLVSRFGQVFHHPPELGASYPNDSIACDTGASTHLEGVYSPAEPTPHLGGTPEGSVPKAVGSGGIGKPYFRRDFNGANNRETARISASLLAQLEERAADWGPCPLTEEERHLVRDCEDQRLDGFTFFQAVLIAGGIPRRELDAYQQMLDEHAQAVKTVARESPDELSAVRNVFGYLHRRILTGGYQIDATNPGIALKTGRYNCVSAAILFKLLAEAAGYPTRIEQLPTHAFCRVETTFASIPVECTAPRWLDEVLLPQFGLATKGVSIGSRDYSMEDDLGRLVSASRVSERDWRLYEQGRTMSETQIVGTIYYNRGVDALFSRQFDRALFDNIVALRLDPTNQSAKDNLLASLNNWAIALAEAQHFPQAAERLYWALRCAPSAQPVQANLTRLFRQWKTTLAREGCAAEFRTEAEKGLRELSSIPGTESVQTNLRALLAE
ncbi:hypothetical protein [Thermogutta sp.]|uniref:hypothetical protein n=1 Tax=Thermogutta sp. TaxID=1962930 RepID=UPI00321F8C6E